MSEREQQALQLCEAGLRQMWEGDVEAAIAAYDGALAAVESDETRELITIRKAEALIAAEREGTEIAALPAIVLRRRTPRHVYMAATVLMRRFVEADDRRKAIFYGEIARKAVVELDDVLALASVLNHLGITLVADSQFASAIGVLEEGLTAIAPILGVREEARALEASLLVNLGGAKVLCDDTAGGVAMLESVFARLDDGYTIAETCLDLCFGHMQLEQYAAAEMYGRRALELASVKRQVRNANHLLAEICLRTERYDESDQYFDVVAAFYPEFRNVKQLLVAVDLCSVVNWKA
jgi:tetratricopeptide (TPR) repeat protein